MKDTATETGQIIGGAFKAIIWLLQIIFVVLKLTQSVDWHWGWVLSPLITWVSVLVFFTLLFIILNLFKR